MGKVIGLLLGATALSGCSVSLAGTLPDPHGHLVRYAVHAHTASSTAGVLALAPATTLSEPHSAMQVAPGIDLSSALHSALQVPSQIAQLEHAIIVCTALLALVGVLNAGLLVAVLAAKRRAPVAGLAMENLFGSEIVRAASAKHDPAPAATVPSLRIPETADAGRETRSCACGVTISARSRSGRCRRCAQGLRGAAGATRAAAKTPLEFAQAR